jgi:hypothetical protein
MFSDTEAGIALPVEAGMSAEESYPHVQVKNTFIQVGGDATSLGGRRRQTHQRCVSEPLWLVQTHSSPDAIPLPPTVPEGDAANGAGFSYKSCFCQAEDVSTTASSPRPAEDPISERVAASRTSQDVRPVRRNHCRQLSTQTIDSFDMDVAYVPQELARSSALEEIRNSEESPETFSSSCPSFGEAANSENDVSALKECVQHPSSCTRECARQGDRPVPCANMRFSEDSSFGSSQQHLWAQRLHTRNTGDFPQHFAHGKQFAPPQELPHRVMTVDESISPRPGMAVQSNQPAFLSTNPAWQPPTNQMLAGWGRSRPELDAEVVASAAYARGVAAGVAQAAFERGFAAGAASLTEGAANSISQPRTIEQAARCKWDAQGTCKFGASCRYSHERETRQPLQVGLQVNANAIALASPRQQTEQADQCHQLEQAGQCHLVWCDQRAFKESADALKNQLENETRLPVKCYRTADMCMRLLRKKENFKSAKPVSRVFLVSMTNARALMPFLSERPFLAAKVIILCDTCGTKGCNRTDKWALQYPMVEGVAATWQEAVDALKRCT